MRQRKDQRFFPRASTPHLRAGATTHLSCEYAGHTETDSPQADPTENVIAMAVFIGVMQPAAGLIEEHEKCNLKRVCHLHGPDPGRWKGS